MDINERFLSACENGDYTTVKGILKAIKDFNIDITDNLGRSALRLAVENEHLEVKTIKNINSNLNCKI
jgi:ankyrin repeat protein